jgi:hypothetical protein
MKKVEYSQVSQGGTAEVSRLSAVLLAGRGGVPMRFDESRRNLVR